MEIQFGKKIISYFNGVPSEKTEFHVPVLVNNKSEVLRAIIEAIDLITTRQTKVINIKITADEDYKIKKVVKEFSILDK